MPELPHITIYLESLQSRIAGERLEKIRIASPFLLRSVEPPVHEAEGRSVRHLRRIGKQIVWDFGDELLKTIEELEADPGLNKTSGTRERA